MFVRRNYWRVRFCYASVLFIALGFCCFVPSKLRDEMFFTAFICAGFLSSQQFDQLAFNYEKHRTLGVVPGYQYDIICNDNDAVPDWYYKGEIVTDSASAAAYQISEGPNAKTLRFGDFSADQVGEYTCKKPCGNCTINIGTGETPLCACVHDLCTHVFVYVYMHML